MLDKIIANRARSRYNPARLRQLGIKTVAVHSTADYNLKHVCWPTVVCIGRQPHQKLPQHAGHHQRGGSHRRGGIHPVLASCPRTQTLRARGKERFPFIGPRADVIRMMGDKVSAINVMKKAGVPCVPGSSGPLGDVPEENHRIARDIGYPVIIKASRRRWPRHARGAHGSLAAQCHRGHEVGGARRLQQRRYTWRNSWSSRGTSNSGARRQLRQRDPPGRTRLLHANREGGRRSSCTSITEEQRERMGARVVGTCKTVGYRNAGTLEFLYRTTSSTSSR